MLKKIFFGIIIVLVIIVGFFVIDDWKVKRDHEQRVEKSTVDFLKPSIDLYYIDKGKYPLRISDMQDVMETTRKGLYTELEQAINKLKDFKYEVRGDSKAYRITYTNNKGESISVEGSYTSEFHNYNK